MSNACPSALPKLPQGFTHAAASNDSPCGRARIGVFAIDRRRLNVAPYLNSNESLVVEWDGIKATFEDAELLDETIWSADVQAAIKLYVQYCHARDFGTDLSEESKFKARFDEKLSDLLWQCRQETMIRESETCPDARLPLASEVAHDKPTAVALPTTVVAMIADYGQDVSAEGDVAALVDGWSPNAIVTAGDNWYGSTDTLTDLDAKVGKYYHKHLSPYYGSYGEIATVQRFHAALGNHDRDSAARLSLWKDYFHHSKEYYSVRVGVIEFFILDSGLNSAEFQQQADGNTFSSVQGSWLQGALSASTASWKIVVLHHPPYSSGSAHGEYPDLRWPFKDWGADLVVSGHAHTYERLSVGSLHYLTIGTGGAPLTGFFSPAMSYSQLRYNADYGALKLTATCDALTVEFITRTGVVIDTIQFAVEA